MIKIPNFKQDFLGHLDLELGIYKRHLLNTAHLCWADENRFAEDEMF